MIKIFEWYKKNTYELGFFISGWCTLAGVRSIFDGDLVWALMCFALAWLNVKLVK